jgi:AmmeMemoRadiSam system protein B/AmmeMemoRadiSam system protein A
MKRHIFQTLALALCICLVNVSAAVAKADDDIRKPGYAGSFYPSGRSELAQTIEALTRQIKPPPVPLPAKTALKILVMPHAGYVYSGLTAAHIALALKKNQFDRVIVLGPDHHIGFAGAAISAAVAYETPLGRIPVHEDASVLRRDTTLFHTVPASDRREHAIEVVLPFLQVYLGKFTLIPLVLGPADIDRYADAIDPLLDHDTLLVVSSDLSHYLSYSAAVAKDRQTIKDILNLDDNSLAQRANAACGKIPIRVAMNLARRHRWQPFLLHYSNSGDTAGDRAKVVGYAAIAFYGGTTMQNQLEPSQRLTHQQGRALLQIARKTIAERLGLESVNVASDTEKDPAFQDHRGTFVTLTIDGQLRGCIGNLGAGESILSGVKQNAINAAFHDPRFAALTPDEYPSINIEISILTEPQPLAYGNSSELLPKLRVNVDGVILRKKNRSATFLPQVWKQLPRPEQFLSHLCMKAGLAADAWEKEHLDILTYQVQYFEEEK